VCSSTREALNWVEVVTNYGEYVYQFTRPMMNRRPPVIINQLSSQSTDKSQVQIKQLLCHRPSDAPHRRFEELFHIYQKHSDSRTIAIDRTSCLRIHHRYIERNAISCVLEVKLMSIPMNNYQTANKQPVCLLKMVLLVNLGVIDYIQFIAPHEDWTFIENTSWSQKKIDLSVESRYELYQGLTAQGNIFVNHFNSRNYINDFKNFFIGITRFYTLDQPCRFCRKILRDFSPAIIIDMHRKHYHLGCR